MKPLSNSVLFFLCIHSTPTKAEQPLQGMELQEKEAQKHLCIEEISLERNKEPRVNRCLLILDLKPFRL